MEKIDLDSYPPTDFAYRDDRDVRMVVGIALFIIALVVIGAAIGIGLEITGVANTPIVFR